MLSLSDTLHILFTSLMVLTAALCAISTPFGFPVVPDVYMTYAVASYATSITFSDGSFLRSSS